MDKEIRNILKKNAKEVLKELSKDVEAYHWGLGNEGDCIVLLKSEACGCLKEIGYFEVPLELDLLETIDEVDEEIETLLRRISRGLKREDELMYLDDICAHPCGCSECEEYDEE